MDGQELHILRLLRGCFSSRLLRISTANGTLSPKFPEGSARFPPDGRATTYTVVGRIAAWDEGYSGADEGCVLSTPGSAEEKYACLSLPVAKARGAKKAAKRPATKRDRGPASEASVPSRIAGNGARSCGRFRWQVPSSVGLLPSRRLAVGALRCWEFLLPRPALREARTLLGAGASVSRIRLAVKPARAVPPKGEVPPRQPLDVAEVLAKLAALDKPGSSRSVDEEFGVDPGVATAETEYTDVLNGGGSGGMRGPATERPCPGAALCAPITNAWDNHSGA